MPTYFDYEAMDYVSIYQENTTMYVVLDPLSIDEYYIQGASRKFLSEINHDPLFEESYCWLITTPMPSDATSDAYQKIFPEGKLRDEPLSQDEINQYFPGCLSRKNKIGFSEFHNLYKYVNKHTDAFWETTQQRRKSEPNMEHSQNQTPSLIQKMKGFFSTRSHTKAKIVQIDSQKSDAMDYLWEEHQKHFAENQNQEDELLYPHFGSYTFP